MKQACSEPSKNGVRPSRALIPAGPLLAVLLSVAIAPALRADSVRVASVSAGSDRVAVVPVYVRDTSGTPLGTDAGAGKRIQSISFKVSFSPAASVSSASVARSGVLAGLTPLFESAPSAAGSISYLASFPESTSPIPFTLNKSGGDEVAKITVTLSGAASPASTVTLTLEPATTSLSNQAGTVSETPPGSLTLENGSVQVPPMTASFSPSRVELAPGKVEKTTLKLSLAAPSALTIELKSSNVAVATVPATVSADSGATSVQVAVTGVAAGSCSVTARLPAPVGGASAAATAVVYALPSAPGNPDPADGAQNVAPSASLRWSAVSNAQSYVVRLGKSTPPPLYGSAHSPSMSVTLEANTTYYWQVAAVNAAGSAPGSIWSFRTAGIASCTRPVAPVLSAAAEAGSGGSYEITWTPVADATEVEIEESTDPNFVTKSSRIVPAPASAASFEHDTARDVRYYYRALARNGISGCGAASGWSNIATILVRGAQLRVIPVVSSTNGAFGSRWRTCVQLHNETAEVIAGTLTFHPAGRSAGPGDPQMAFALAARETRTCHDLLSEMGTSGAGSIDVEMVTGELPHVVTRVYNDGGEDGTAGFGQPVFDPADALDPGVRGCLIAPPDPERFRFNIGIRTFGEPVTVAFDVIDEQGTAIRTVTLDYPASYFEQRSATEMLGSIGASDVIEIRLQCGQAIVYGASTDNVTQDPTVQFASRTK